MLRRIITLAAFMLLVLTFTFPAAAQPSDWSLYLFDSSTQQLIRVTLDGRQQLVNIDIPAGSYLSQQAMDFTPDGSRAAYCNVVNAADGAHASLLIKDLMNPSAPVVAADFGLGDGCWVKYSADASQIAVGVVHHYAGDPNADPNVPACELSVVDAASGQPLYQMSAVKGGSLFDATHTIMPEVRYFANKQIIFAGLPWGTEGIPVSPAYLWQLSGDSIQPIDRWWRWGLDSLPTTGELVWTELDSSLPAANPGGPVPQANVVKLADKSGQERVIYANPDWVILDTKFIDNGRQLAINELQAADVNQTPGNQATRWLALDRSGVVSELATTQGFSQVAAAPDGYVILWASDNSATPVMTLEYHTGRETTPLWHQQQSGGVTWTLLWTAPTATADGLPPFAAAKP